MVFCPMALVTNLWVLLGCKIDIVGMFWRQLFLYMDDLPAPGSQEDGASLPHSPVIGQPVGMFAMQILSGSVVLQI